MFENCIGQIVSGPMSLMKTIPAVGSSLKVVTLSKSKRIVDVSSGPNVMSETLSLKDFEHKDEYNFVLILDSEEELSNIGKIKMLMDSLSNEMMNNNLVLLDCLVRHGDRFKSTLCDNINCCPEDGKPIL